jgi:hypothetical protein
MYPQIERYLAERVAEFSSISRTRQRTLTSLRRWVVARRDAGDTIRLMFLSHDNSRRSLMAQALALAASHNYGLDGLTSYSGGAEPTALNIRALGALRRAGFAAATRDDNANPSWMFRFDSDLDPVELFSKRLRHPSNPRKDLCAITISSEAEKAFKKVPGADVTISLHYKDPRKSDGTSDEVDVYDGCCAQIAREMAWVFARLGS